MIGSLFLLDLRRGTRLMFYLAKRQSSTLRSHTLTVLKKWILTIPRSESG